jgi:hypothetical protein
MKFRFIEQPLGWPGPKVGSDIPMGSICGRTRLSGFPLSAVIAIKPFVAIRALSFLFCDLAADRHPRES